MSSMQKRPRMTSSDRCGRTACREIEEWAGQLLSGWWHARDTDHPSWPAGSAPR